MLFASWKVHENPASRAVQSVEKRKSVNAVGTSTDSEKISSKIRDLKELVGINGKICEL